MRQNDFSWVLTIPFSRRVAETKLMMILAVLMLAAAIPVLGYYYSTDYDVLSDTELQSLRMEFADWPQEKQSSVALAIVGIFYPRGDPRAANYLIDTLIRVFNEGKTDMAKVAASKVFGKIGEPAVVPLINDLTGGTYYLL